MQIAKRVTLAALLGLSLLPLRLATAQTGDVEVTLVILAPPPSGSTVTTTTSDCTSTSTTCTKTTIIATN